MRHKMRRNKRINFNPGKWKDEDIKEKKPQRVKKDKILVNAANKLKSHEWNVKEWIQQEDVFRHEKVQPKQNRTESIMQTVQEI